MEFTVCYFEAATSVAQTLEARPRVAVGMLHAATRNADGDSSHNVVELENQILKIVEMDDTFGVVNPVTKMVWLRRSPRHGEVEMVDLADLRPDAPEIASARAIMVAVYRLQERVSISAFCMEIVLRLPVKGETPREDDGEAGSGGGSGGSLVLDSFLTNPNQCLRVVDARVLGGEPCAAIAPNAVRTRGGVRRIWPGDRIAHSSSSSSDAYVTLVVESIPSLSQMTLLPSSAFDQFALTSSCDPAVVFAAAAAPELAAADAQRLAAWRRFATPCGRASYLRNTALKDALRLGIPAARRAEVYCDLTDTLHESKLGRSREHFHNVLRTVFRIPRDQPVPVALDTRYPPHFGSVLLGEVRGLFGLNSRGLSHLKAVMCAIGEAHADVHTCPLLVPVAALLLHFLAPEDTFSVLHHVVAASRHKNITERLFFVRVTHAEHISQATVAGQLVRTRYQRIGETFDQLGVSLDATMLEMISCFFSNVLPTPFLWRVLDSFLNEGHKVIIRFALSIVKHLEMRIYSCNSASELEQLFTATSEKGCFRGMSQQSFTFVANFAFNMQLSRQEVEEIEVQRRGEASELAQGSAQVGRTTTTTQRLPFLRHRPRLDPVPDFLPSAAAAASVLEPLFLWCDAATRVTWRRLFCAAIDGWNLQSLYRCVEERRADASSSGGGDSSSSGAPRIIVFAVLADLDARDSIIGVALTCAPLPTGGHYRGGSASFAFSLGKREAKFAATQENKYFVLCEQSHLTFGGGGGGGEGEGAPRPMLRLGDDLQSGVSYDCPTFDSPSFAPPGSADGRLEIAALEVYEIV